MRKYFLLSVLLFQFQLVQAQNRNVAEENPLEVILKSNPAAFDHILRNKDSFRVQIVYTAINRKRNNKASFTEYSYNLNNQTYFYPASTVKMPVALLALEKLNELNIPGLDMNSTMITDSSAPTEDYVYNQPQSSDGRPTIANYIQQIFLVSSNDAFNRLYEFLGQEYIQQKLREKGYPDAIIRHRLQISRTPEQNAVTNAIRFYDTSGNLLYSQPAQTSKAVHPAVDASLGKGYYSNGKLVNSPFSFNQKNRVYLQDFHHMMQAVMFPETTPKKKRFKLTEADYGFIRKWMGAYPEEGIFSPYDTAKTLSANNKALYYGAGNKAEPQIRIFNKIGGAYGFLVDVAYVVDLENKVEYLLSATISCNSDGIYNDDRYDYETLGYPFLKELGRAVHRYELQRKRRYLPDLQSFVLQY
ncbi:MAG: serine hydrolase [Sediminibacterium sp.]|nr:serine hydrolase [Sediminibacterium sp.]